MRLSTLALISLLFQSGCQEAPKASPPAEVTESVEEVPPIIHGFESGRFTIIPCQITEDGKDINTIVRLDTMTGRTWRYGTTKVPSAKGQISWQTWSMLTELPDALRHAKDLDGDHHPGPTGQ
jgi:hypothetical protein